SMFLRAIRGSSSPVTPVPPLSSLSATFLAKPPRSTTVNVCKTGRRQSESCYVFRGGTSLARENSRPRNRAMGLTVRQVIDSIATYGIMSASDVTALREKVQAEIDNDAEPLMKDLVRQNKLTKF